MKTYILTDKTWFRGCTSEGSYIGRPDNSPGPLCCLGNAVAQEGIVAPPATKTLGQVGDLPPHLHRLSTSVGSAASVYTANDELNHMTDQERVELINRRTQPFGFQFEFRAEE